jgi:hypothetical protein
MPKHKTHARLTNRFDTGKRGLCEAYLFEFHELGMGEPRTLTIAAARLEDALSHLRGDAPDFQIMSVQNLGLIVMVSGSPLD